jgi:ribonuclease HI
MALIINATTRNVSLPLGDGPATNQRAELMAIKKALDRKRVRLSQDVVVYTDSQYAIKNIVQWEKLVFESWKHTRGYRYENEETIKEIVEIIRQRTTAGAQTDFQWVKGHQKDKTNCMQKGRVCHLPQP